MASIVVVGSYVTDLTARAPHMPKPGETVLGGPFKMGPGGKGGNQAVAAARQGADVTMVTKVGKDLFGENALSNFTNEGINTSYIVVDDHEATGAALITVDPASENMIVVSLGACGTLTKEEVANARNEMEKADVVLVQLETSLEAVTATINLAAELEKPIILNPAPYQEVTDELLSKVTYITPNETEASLLTGIEVSDVPSAREAAMKLADKGVEVVIITLGKQGCFVYERDGDEKGELIAGFSVQAVDTTGAGDAFNGAFATFISDGMSLKQAARRANAVAALSVTKEGTAPAMPYVEDLRDLIKEFV
jgi:ribokinase